MHKKVFMVLFIFLCFTICANFNKVEAYSLNGGEITYRLEEEDKACEGILGNPNNKDSFAYMLQQIFTIMQYVAPVLCLVLSTADFLKAAASQDKEGLTKAFKTTGKRLIFTVLIFFLPLLINFLFHLLGWYGTCGIE